MSLAAGATLAVSASVAAADGNGNSSAPVAYQWNGLSVGAGIGAGKFGQNVSGEAWREDQAEAYLCTVSGLRCLLPRNWDWREIWSDQSGVKSGPDSDDWNFFGTVQLSYDRLIGNRFVIGAFADLDFYKDSVNTFSEVDGNNWLSGRVDREHSWAIGGRLGYLVTPRVLLYGLAGYSQMKLEGSLDAHLEDPIHLGPIYLGPHSEPSVKIKEKVDGWTIGAGLETKLESRLSLKLEYRYSQFDGAAASVSSPEDTQQILLVRRTYSDGGSLNLGDTDIHSVRAVLSFKLGHDSDAPAPLK